MLPAERYQKAKAGAVLALLHDITERHGYLPAEEVRKAASNLSLPLSQVYGAASFYTSFSFKPLGRYKIHLCEGTACYVRGAAELLQRLRAELGIEPDQTTEDLLYTLKKVHCVGSCGLAPVIRVNNETYGRLGVGDVTDILANYQDGDEAEVIS
jgi:NADH:ubiquinone oxidoreductase subunit E